MSHLMTLWPPKLASSNTRSRFLMSSFVRPPDSTMLIHNAAKCHIKYVNDAYAFLINQGIFLLSLSSVTSRVLKAKKKKTNVVNQRIVHQSIVISCQRSWAEQTKLCTIIPGFQFYAIHDKQQVFFNSYKTLASISNVLALAL